MENEHVNQPLASLMLDVGDYINKLDEEGIPLHRIVTAIRDAQEIHHDALNIRILNGLINIISKYDDLTLSDIIGVLNFSRASIEAQFNPSNNFRTDGVN